MTHRPNTQSFSGTDLRKNDIPGIVYPLAKADNQISVSSIIEHRQGSTNLARCEARICNSTDNSVDYEKGICISYVKGEAYTIHPSSAQTFAGIKSKFIDTSYCLTDGINDQLSKDIIDICHIWDEIDYVANTQFVKACNISKKSVLIPSLNFSKDNLFENEIEEINLDKVVEELNLAYSKHIKNYLLGSKAFSRMNDKEKLKYLHNVSKDWLEKPFKRFAVDSDLEHEYADLILDICDEYCCYI